MMETLFSPVWVGELVRLLAAGALGVFAGAMLTEGLVLVPYWRSLTAERFYAWYGENHARLVAYFGPLTWIAGLAALISAAASSWQAHDAATQTAAAAVLSLAAVLLFPLYFKNANASFLERTLSDEGLHRELGRWARWHWLRSGLSLAAAGMALRAI
jgi:hypothetical protein